MATISNGNRSRLSPTETIRDPRKDQALAAVRARTALLLQQSWQQRNLWGYAVEGVAEAVCLRVGLHVVEAHAPWVPAGHNRSASRTAEPEGVWWCIKCVHAFWSGCGAAAAGAG